MARKRSRNSRCRSTLIHAVYGGGAGICKRSRSGSNAFHGSAFYYNRNSATGANDAIDKAAGFAKPQDSLQQFGGGVGESSNRLWFFVDYEQQLRSDPISVINPVLEATQPGFFVFEFHSGRDSPPAA